MSFEKNQLKNIRENNIEAPSLAQKFKERVQEYETKMLAPSEALKKIEDRQNQIIKNIIEDDRVNFFKQTNDGVQETLGENQAYEIANFLGQPNDILERKIHNFGSKRDTPHYFVHIHGENIPDQLRLEFQNLNSEKKCIQSLIINKKKEELSKNDRLPQKSNEQIIFEHLYSEEPEIQTGFEPEDFLQKKGDFESQTEKIAFLKERLKEQINAVNKLINIIEKAPSYTPTTELFEEVTLSPEFDLLSKKQKHTLRKGLFKYKHQQENLEEFIKYFADLESNEIIERLMNINDEGFVENSVEIERIGNSLVFYTENKDLQNLNYGEKKEHRTKCGGLSTNSRYHFPIVIINKSHPNQKAIMEHELRHSRDQFIASEEKNNDLKSIKYEFLAYIKDEVETLEEIRDILLRKNGLYYPKAANKEEYENVVNKTYETLCQLDDLVINLDILAMFPLNKWDFLIKNKIISYNYEHREIGDNAHVWAEIEDF